MQLKHHKAFWKGLERVAETIMSFIDKYLFPLFTPLGTLTIDYLEFYFQDDRNKKIDKADIMYFTGLVTALILIITTLGTGINYLGTYAASVYICSLIKSLRDE